MAAIAIIGGVISAIGSIASASAQAQAASYNAAVARRNASAVSSETYLKQEDQRRDNRRNLGTIKAAYGQNNLQMAGSPLDVLQDSSIEGEWDVAKIGFEGQLKAEQYREEANLYDMQAKSAQTAGFIGAASGLLGGFTQAANAPGSSLLQAA